MSATVDSGLDVLGVVEPTAANVKAARTLLPTLRQTVQEAGGEKDGTDDVVDLRLPIAVAQVVTRMVEELADGHTVSATAVGGDAELSTQQAADLLRISRPTLIRLLDRGKIEHRMAGTHRRVDLASLFAYRARSQGAAQPELTREQKLRALREMAKLTDEMGLGY